MQIELEFPPAELFPNRSKGKHWAVTHKARSQYRETSYWLTMSQKGDWKPIYGELSLGIIFVMPDKRWRDADNCLAAAKAGLDGMADALEVNDRQFNPITIHRVIGKKPGKIFVKVVACT